MRHINRDASSGSRNHGTVTDSALNATLQATKGSGRPLAAPTKTFMEASFGMNLDGVRLHTDHRAEEMSRSLGAAAFTYGRNIYFNSGQYNPDNTKGTKLLAHELVHTVQQGFHDRPITRDIPISSPGEPEERQAESISAGVVGNASRNSERVLKSVNGIKTQRIQPKIQMARNVDVAVYETKDHGAGYDDAPSETFKLEANSIKEAGSKLNTFIKVARRMFDSSTAINKLSFYGHGAPGFQSVGAGEGYDSAKEISVDSINAFPDDYKQIYAPLSNGANFYLRGCNVGAGAKGLEVLKKIKTSCKTLAGKDIEAYGWTGKSYHHRVLAVDWYEQTGQRVSSSDKSPKITWEKLKKKGAGKK
ncbi:MAG: DUF4157 domain-containing protein [Chloroflexi bacterium]|nr:DUF4157 domain-containing protein [Chloroflexota bacterium]